MQKTLVLALLLAAAALASTPAETGPLEPQVPPWQHLLDGLVPADQGQNYGTSTAVNGPEPDPSLQGGGGSNAPSETDGQGWQRPALDWGDDILVAEPVREYNGRISLDNDNLTDDIYICIFNEDPTEEDTGHIWLSTNGGATWQKHSRVRGTAVVGDLNDVQLLCGHGPGDTAWVYTVVEQSILGLRIRRMSRDSSAFKWITIDTSTTVRRVALDRNTENPEHLFCAWERDNGYLYIMSSTDAGETWGNAQAITNDARGVSLAAAGDGVGYVAYMRNSSDSTYYVVARFENNLVTPNWEFDSVDMDANHRFRQLAIAAERTSPGNTQTVITLATYRRNDNNNIAPRYAWTTNGGGAWTSSWWPVVDVRSTWLARFPRIRYSYDDDLFRGIVTMPETTADWDTLVYAYATAAHPDSWTGRTVINEHRATGEVWPDVGYCGLAGGGIVAYRENAARSVWFDGWDFTGIEAGPTPVQPSRMTTVFGGEANLTLPRRSHVSAAVYDQDGRLVRKLLNGTMEAGQHRLDPGVTSGVCFLRVTVDGKTETAKLVRLQ